VQRQRQRNLRRCESLSVAVLSWAEIVSNIEKGYDKEMVNASGFQMQTRMEDGGWQKLQGPTSKNQRRSKSQSGRRSAASLPILVSSSFLPLPSLPVVAHPWFRFGGHRPPLQKTVRMILESKHVSINLHVKEQPCRAEAWRRRAEFITSLEKP
jgi:hypothetical protein